MYQKAATPRHRDFLPVTREDCCVRAYGADRRRLPEVVNLQANGAIVDLLHAFHRPLVERGNLDRGHVVLDLGRILAAGDGAGDGRVHQDPTQRELRQRVPLRHEPLELFGGPQPRLEVHARERLAPVEGLAVTVEVPVVGGVECPLRAHLAGEEAARERHAGQDAYVALLGEREELLDGLLAEDVEDDLDGLDAGVVQRHPRLLHPLHAHAVVLYLAGPLQLLERLEGRVLTVSLRGRAVELEKVKRLDAEVPEAPLDEGREVLGVVPFGGVRVEAAAGLGRDEDLVARAVLEQPADELLAAAIAVDVGGIEKVDAEVYSAVEGGVGVVLAHGPPLAAEGPGAEADLGHPHPGLSQAAVVQVSLLSSNLVQRSVYVGSSPVAASSSGSGERC